jgi:RNA polymerase sigma factor (sigma-70 family)
MDVPLSATVGPLEAPSQFQQLWDDYHQTIYRYARRRVPEADAVDIVSETFLVAWRRGHELPERPLPWLYGIARNTVANQNRSRQRQDRLVGRLAAVEEASTPDPLVASADRDLVGRALGQLRDSDRELLRLAYWEDLKGRDLAVAFGCSEPAARLRLHRAKLRLRRICDDQRRNELT